jgi:two-component system LytT family sensor kinase
MKNPRSFDRGFFYTSHPAKPAIHRAIPTDKRTAAAPFPKNRNFERTGKRPFILAEPSLNTMTTPETPFAAADIRNSGLFKRRWLYHVLFWLGYFGLTVVLYLSIGDTLDFQSHMMLFTVLIFQAAFAYFNIYILIPRLLFEKKYYHYALALFFTIVVCSATNLSIEALWYHFHPRPAGHRAIFTIKNLTIGSIEEVYLVGLATGFKFLKDSILNQQRQKEKEKHYLETELKFLKSQIQPHFFFNTLNNIYSLTLKKSEQAPEVVLKLSDLMSYMLYESNAAWVPLTKEINYLHNYLDVEQLRFGRRLSVAFTIEGATGEASIPPMILILFLENSFKHGVKNNISKIHISISLVVENGYLYFRVENPASEEEMIMENNGIGLRNARRRLDLLFGNDYTLDIHEKDRRFIVSLKMPVC